jgi:tRNA(Ile)-lysidine synthase
MNPNLPNTVLRFSELMRQYEDNFNFHYKQFQKLIMYLGNSIVLDISKEIDYFEIIIMHLLHQNIEEQFGIQPILGDLEKIVSLRNKEKGTLAELSNGLLAVRESSSIIIRKLGPDRFDGVRIHIGKTFDGEYFSFAVHLTARRKLPKKERFSELIDFRKIQNGLILRAWSAGDKFRPLGMKGAKKVSDLLTDEKISHSIRSKILVLCDGGEIIWVCGVRLSDKYKITKSTKEFLELKIRYNFELQQ